MTAPVKPLPSLLIPVPTGLRVTCAAAAAAAARRHVTDVGSGLFPPAPPRRTWVWFVGRLHVWCCWEWDLHFSTRPKMQEAGEALGPVAEVVGPVWSFW